MNTAPGAYRQAFDQSLADPAQFWGEAARSVSWIRNPRQILDDSSVPLYRWFPGAVLNTCYNALDRHIIAGRGDQLALIYDSPVAGLKQQFTYVELTQDVAKFAGVLAALGVQAGDRVLLYLPMIPQAVVAMLACARIGAVHSVVFGGFAANELAARISDARPKVIVAASCGLEPTRVIAYQPLLAAALSQSEHTPDRCIIVGRPQLPAVLGDRDLDYATLMADETIHPAGCVAVAAMDPLYILYTSGTTGKPKGIVRDHGGHAVALTWSMRNIYDIGPGDVILTASDVGWVVGHSYIVYGPLFAGATTVLYEGKPVGTPDPGAFWRLVAEYGIKVLFTAPTAMRALKRDDPDGQFRRRYDTSSLQTLFLAGERLDPDTYQWASELLGIPVVDHWWQTETGWAIAANPRGLQTLALKPGSASVPMPGFDVVILDAEGRHVPAGDEGAIAITLPLPPGTMTGVWGDEQRFTSSYLSTYPGYYVSGDGGYLDSDGYVFVLGRTDDVMNVAGHRLSAGQIEAALASHPAVAECAVIGVHDALKGQAPRALVVLKAGLHPDADELARELNTRVREQVGPIATLAGVSIVPALPKTRSGKILRATMRQLADGKPAPVPSTIEDPAVLESLKAVLRPS